MTKSTAITLAKKNKIVGLEPAARYFVSKSKAQNTLRAYKSDLEDFARWCQSQRIRQLPVPAVAVANYLSRLATIGVKRSTIRRRIFAIRFWHVENDFETPTKAKAVKAVWEGIQRTSDPTVNKKKPTLIEMIRKMLQVLPDNLIGLRDKSILLLGFAGGFRRSELVALNVNDVDFRKEGLLIIIRRSKADQYGKGKKIPVSYGSNILTCPVRTLEQWLLVSGITTGPLYRRITKGDKLQQERLTPQSIRLIVKKYVREAGFNPEEFAAHSLRSGFATEAARNGAPAKKIKGERWNSLASVGEYIHDVELFEDEASSFLGL